MNEPRAQVFSSFGPALFVAGLAGLFSPSCTLARGTSYVGSAHDSSTTDAGPPDSEHDDAASTDGDPATDSDPRTDTGPPTDSGPSLDGGPSLDSGPSTDSGGGAARPVGLGAASAFVILAQGAVTNTPPSLISGDIGDSAATTAQMTGFAWIADPSNTFSTSPQLVGRAYAADHVGTTPAVLTMAVRDMLLAFTDAASRTPDVSVTGAGNIGGMTLRPGVYRWTAALSIATPVTLNGSATDVWVFQVGAALDMAASARVELSGGARPENVFWRVGAAAALGAGAHCKGIIMADAAITLGAHASITGRLLSRTTVGLDTSSVVAPPP